jgi:nitrogen fixation NifU-like protein
MNDLRDLYQEVILDHYKRPRNFHSLPGASHHADGYNPLCGDKVSVYLVMDGERVKEIGFQGSGCAISTASASLMTEALLGKTAAEAEKLFERFHGMVMAAPDSTHHTELGKLAALEGVREFPARVKCASLAWHTMKSALHNASQPVSTE